MDGPSAQNKSHDWRINLKMAWLRMRGGLLHLDRQKGNSAIALRNAIGVVIALGIGLAINNSYAAVGLSFGALTSSFSDSSLPYRQRGEHLIAAAISVALMIGVGTQIASYWVASAVLVAIVGFAAAQAVCLGNSAADIGLAAIVTITVFSARSLIWADAWKLAMAALAGGMIQAILSLISMPLNPYAPQVKILSNYYRLLMNRAFDMTHAGRQREISLTGPLLPAAETLAALDDDFSPQGQRLRSLFTQGERIAIQLARLEQLIHQLPQELLGTDSVTLSALESIQSRLGIIVEIISHLPSRHGYVGPPNGIFTLEHEQITHDLATHGVPQPQIDDLNECLNMIARQIWIVSDIATDAITARWDNRDMPHHEARYNRKLSESALIIAANLHLQSPAFRHGLRMAIGLVLAMLLERTLHLTNGYWIPMTVGLVLKPDFGATISRGMLRIAGTMVGLILLTGIYAIAPATIASPLIIVGLLIFFLRYLGPMNYGLFAVFISGAIVILLAQSGQYITSLIDARAICTLIGGTIAIIGYLLWPTREETQIGGHIASLIRNHQIYVMSVIGRFDPSLATGESIRTARRRAQLMRTNLEASIIRLSAQTAVKPERNHLLSGIMASSKRIFNAAASMEAMEVTAARKLLIEQSRGLFESLSVQFTTLANDHQTPNQSDLHQIVQMFQSIKPPAGLLEDTIRMEIVRLVNGTNTLTEQITQWRHWMALQAGQSTIANGLPSDIAR